MTTTSVVLHGASIFILASVATAQSSTLSPPTARTTFAGPPPVTGSQLTLSGSSNLVLNGDFENHTGSGCQFNLDNATFGATMANASAFGAANEVDVMDDPGGCFGGFAGTVGPTKVGIHCQAVGGITDEIALELSTATIAGNTYQLEFDTLCVPDFDFCPGIVEIGLGDAASFGTLFATGSSVSGAWTHYSLSVVAPVAATHLTMRVSTTNEAWVHIDGVSLDGGGIGTRVCTANANSTGSAAVLSGAGSDAAGAGNFLDLTSAPVPDQPGIFFYGSTLIDVPFGNGRLCASSGIVRSPVVTGVGNSASYSFENTSFAPGQTAYFQHWFRDPAAGGAFFNTSYALEVMFL